MMVPTRHSSSIFRPYPANHINRKLSVWAFQRCIVRLQQSSFGPDLPGLLLTVNILGQEGDQSPGVINYPKSPVHSPLPFFASDLSGKMCLQLCTQPRGPAGCWVSSESRPAAATTARARMHRAAAPPLLNAPGRTRRKRGCSGFSLPPLLPPQLPPRPGRRSSGVLFATWRETGPTTPRPQHRLLLFTSSSGKSLATHRSHCAPPLGEAR